LNINRQHLTQGAIVSYRLLPKDQPENPLEVWRGKVLIIYNDMALVESLQEGYNGLTEWIEVQQIVGVSHE
jgi:hypothetical protein